MCRSAGSSSSGRHVQAIRDKLWLLTEPPNHDDHAIITAMVTRQSILQFQSLDQTTLGVLFELDRAEQRDMHRGRSTLKLSTLPSFFSNPHKSMHTASDLQKIYCGCIGVVRTGARVEGGRHSYQACSHSNRDSRLFGFRCLVTWPLTFKLQQRHDVPVIKQHVSSSASFRRGMGRLKIGLGRETFSCNHKSVRLILRNGTYAK